MARFDELVRRTVRAWREMRGSVSTAVPAAPDGHARRPVVEPTEPVAPVPEDEPPLVPATGSSDTPETAPASARMPLSEQDDHVVPRGVRVAAAWSWRLVMIAIPVVLVLWGLAKISVVVIPLIIALLLAALLAPVMRLLVRIRVQRSLAAGICVVGGIAAVAGLLTAVINEFVAGFPRLRSDVEQAVRDLHNWLKTGPLHLSDKQLDELLKAAQDWLSGNSGQAVDAATETATTVGHVVVGLFLVLFTLFFFLRDGSRIWHFLCRLMLPAQVREVVHEAGHQVWATLTSYVRATVLVAFVDAAGIGIALWLLDIPLWLPLAALVFLVAFIPIVGATLSGTVAVLVAWVSHGLITAVIVTAVVIAVQQLEGHVLQPLIMGRAVAIHPIAVLIAIATGAVIAGIIGALIAVPIVAVLNTGIRYLHDNRHRMGRPPSQEQQDRDFGPLADKPKPDRPLPPGPPEPATP